MYFTIECHDDPSKKTGQLGSYYGLKKINTNLAVSTPGYCLLEERFMDNKTWAYSMSHYVLHRPSEHEVGPFERGSWSEKYDMELQVYFDPQEIDNENYAVLALFFEVSSSVGDKEDAPLVKSVLNAYVGQNLTVSPLLDIWRYFQPKETTYVYKGSLTTPDCPEIAHWHIRTTPIPISQSAFDQLSEKILKRSEITGEFLENARDLQPLGPRNYECVTLTELIHNANEFGKGFLFFETSLLMLFLSLTMSFFEN